MYLTFKLPSPKFTTTIPSYLIPHTSILPSLPAATHRVHNSPALSTSHTSSIPIKTPKMSPQIPVPIPLKSASSFQSQNILAIPKIKNNDQLPDRATLKTLSSFIKSYRNSPTQSKTSLSISIPLQHTPTPIATPTPSSPLRQPPITTPTTTQTETKPRILPPQPLDHKHNPNTHLKMPHTTTTVTTRPSLLARLRGGKTSRRTYENSTSTHTRHNNRNTRAQPVHHHHRKPSMGDKISGALLKLRGSLTRRPGLKAAGTRRMRGTDGRGSHHVAAY
ncbi:hypothetical protein OCU04_003281 [Sclerotinia nivalis]|uniref:Uncharacterized protein n=1 Tax=Sclerotinia nivalis TaxID=352851 RepID=A0A9X0ASF9_9HELO|nr:hypothetical protein OCU04_003281 [Sclerotinia nivalis]